MLIGFFFKKMFKNGNVLLLLIFLDLMIIEVMLFCWGFFIVK